MSEKTTTVEERLMLYVERNNLTEEDSNYLLQLIREVRQGYEDRITKIKQAGCTCDWSCGVYCGIHSM